MRYAFILRNKLVWPICVQCRVLEVSVSGYHQHQARRLCWFTSALFMRPIAGPMDGRAFGGNCEQRAFAWASDAYNA